MEQWKIISTHPNYAISNLGAVKNIVTNKLKAINPNKDGYMQVTLYPGSKVYFIHRLVATYFIDNTENKPLVNHIDANRQNNAVSNLEWCTHKENAQHMVSIGNNPDYNGANNPVAIFTDTDILYIRNTTNKTDKELALEFNCARTSISSIRCGDRYKESGGFIRVKHSTKPRKGAKNGMSKISEELAKTIKYDTNYRIQQELVDRYNVSIYVVSKIKSGKTWRHI